MNWDDPQARGRLILAIGVEAYNEAYEKHLRESAVATVNGKSIRAVMTRFGRLFAVGDRAFATLEEAKAYAAK